MKRLLWTGCSYQLVPKSSAMTQTGRPTLRHALEDMQKAHEQVFDLIPVQFVTAQHSTAQSRRTLVLMHGKKEGREQRTNEREKVSGAGFKEIKKIIQTTQTSEMRNVKYFPRGGKRAREKKKKKHICCSSSVL